MEKYVPDIVEDGLARFLVKASVCPECGRYMVMSPTRDWGTFPRYHKLTFSAQVKAAGFCVQSGVQSNGEYICKDCMQAGRAWFCCDLCKQKMSTDKIEMQFGNPPVYLCSECYATIPAKKWDDAVSKLSDAHKYEY